MSDHPNGPPGTSEATWRALGGERVRDGWRTPERDCAGRVIGHHTRFDDGRHRNDGPRGLTMLWPRDQHPGLDPDVPLIVAEGVSDTVALLSVGVDAIGTPMAGHGADHLAAIVKGRHVAICRDNDKAGELGASKLAEALRGVAASVRVFGPPAPHKDARAWIVGGAFAEDFMEAAGKADAVRDEPPTPAVAPYRPFPVDVLSPVLRRFIVPTAERMDCDPVFLILPALSMFAGAAGNAVSVVARRGWVEPCAIWTGVVALPGSMKSPTQRAALQPIHDAQRELDSAYAAALNEHERAVFDYKAELDRAKRAAKDGEEVGALPARPEKPPRPQWKVGNTTPEALAHVLAVNPRGVLVQHDELAAMFAFGQYAKGRNGSESGAGLYKSCWSREPYSENRKGEGGAYINVDAPLVSICGGIQPQTLSRVLGEQYIADGLASRFLWAAPPDNPAGFIPERPDEQDVSAEYAAAFRRLLLLRRTPDGRVDPVYLGLRLDAQREAGGWIDRLRDRMRDESDPAVRAALAKMRGYVYRIALVLHLADWAELGGSEPGPIGVGVVRRAMQVADWFAEQAERVYATMNEPEADRAQRGLIASIRSRGGRTTATVLSKSGPKSYRGPANRAALDTALQGLVDAGIARWEWSAPGPTGGAPSREIVLNTAALDPESPLGGSKRRGSSIRPRTAESGTETPTPGSESPESAQARRRAWQMDPEAHG
ncbi:MAG: DUF3987 domain-containing protein [Phycisphaerales bacterium]